MEGVAIHNITQSLGGTTTQKKKKNGKKSFLKKHAHRSISLRQIADFVAEWRRSDSLDDGGGSGSGGGGGSIGIEWGVKSGGGGGIVVGVVIGVEVAIYGFASFFETWFARDLHRAPPQRHRCYSYQRRRQRPHSLSLSLSTVLSPRLCLWL